MTIVTRSATVVLLFLGLFKQTFGFTLFDKNLLCIDSTRCSPFLPMVKRRQPQHLTAPFDRVTGTTSKTAIHAEGKKSVSYDGVDRGRYFLALVFFICIWQFSIPPTFRRAKFCPPACVKERALCRTPCVTIEEWTSDIVQYYKNGGGIQWDFSIDPNTLAENEKFVKNLFGNK